MYTECDEYKQYYTCGMSLIAAAVLTNIVMFETATYSFFLLEF